MARRSKGPTPTERRMEKLLGTHAGSGLTLAEFARRRRIPVGRLRWWRHELGRRAGLRQTEGSGDGVGALIPVGVTPFGVAPGAVPDSPRDLERISVEFPDGVRVHVPGDCSAKDLREILESVRSAC